MPTAPDLALPPSLGTPFIVALITEPPGALAIVSRTSSWAHVVRLTPPRRGKRFSRHTETGLVLHALHTDGLLGQVFINVPDAYGGVIGDGADIDDPDIVHLAHRLQRLGAQAMITATPLWRPYFDPQDGTGTLADRMAASLPDAVRGTPHEEAQCTDALLLALFASADAEDGVTAPFVLH